MLRNRRLAAILTILYCTIALPAHAEDDRTLSAMMWGQKSAEYRAICRLVYNVATQVMAEKLRLGNYPRDTQGRPCAPPRLPNVGNGLPLAVIMDLDETVLDNSGFQAYLLKTKQQFNQNIWARWIQFQASTPDRAVPGAVEFIRAVEAQGITVLYISNRDEATRAAVLSAVTSLGVGTRDLDARVSLLRADDKEKAVALLERLHIAPESVEGKAVLQAQSQKERRRLEAAEKYTIVGYFGDDLNDFPIYVPRSLTPGPALLDFRRTAVERNLAKWGTEFFVLPNPIYGSWLTSIGKTPPLELLDDQGFSTWLESHKAP